MYEIMDKIPINLEKIGSSLDLEHGWYTSKTPAKLDHIFSEIYQAKELESSGYFKIKAVEILYHIDQLTKNKGCDFKYFEKGQIQATKRIHEYLIQHLEERLSLEELAEEEHINLSLFHKIFAQIYGDTPYAYLKKYKMNLAAQMLQENNRKISDIALELGYSNPSKFAKAFYSVYGKLPKDFRKDQ
jgi:AraC-like DNA-binding protein